jgi:hypothetical protein
MRAKTSCTYQFLQATLLVAFLFWGSVGSAQQYSASEVTVGLAARTFGEEPSACTGLSACKHYLQVPTPSFTYTHNLSPSLAIEGVVEPWSQFFPTSEPYESGHETVALGGIKGGWRGRRWGFYGTTRVGITSGSCDTNYGNSSSCLKRITNFALEYGGALEYRLSRNYALRFDAAHRLSLEFDQVTSRNRSATVLTGGGTLQHLDLRVGVTRNFGVPHPAAPERSPAPAAWDVGASFVLQPKMEPIPWDLEVDPSAGIWSSWNFSRHLSWDTALIHTGPGRDSGHNFANYQAGGRSFEALTGLKMGLRRDRMGYFATARGGTITFGETERSVGILPNGSVFINRGMFTNPVLDAGGVWEVYPSRHTLLRFDAGSATIFYQPKSVWQYAPKNGVETGTKYAIAGFQQTGMLISFGAGFRF